MAGILRALGVAPPLVVTKADLREILRVIGLALDETLAHVEREKLARASPRSRYPSRR
jgi:hypothetical protein